MDEHSIAADRHTDRAYAAEDARHSAIHARICKALADAGSVLEREAGRDSFEGYHFADEVREIMRRIDLVVAS